MPQTPYYWPVSWGLRGIYYCIDADNAKSLLKNRELDTGYQQELIMILENLKGKE